MTTPGGPAGSEPPAPLRPALPLARRLNRNALTVAAALAGVTVLTVLVVANPSHPKSASPTSGAPGSASSPTPAQPTFLDQPPQALPPSPPSPSPLHVQTPAPATAPPMSPAPAAFATLPVPPTVSGLAPGGGDMATGYDGTNGPTGASAGTVLAASGPARTAQPSARYQAYQAALVSGVMVGDASATTTPRNGPNLPDSLAGPTVPLVDSARVPTTGDAPYIVRAGTVIPGLLITGINSDLPGNILGQTSRDVYDTRTEQQLLIPKGSKLIGTYDSRSVGTGRLIVSWSRLIFPDGHSIELPRLLGTDIEGQSGLHDEVNHHYGRIYGSALLMSIISAGAQLSQPQQSSLYAAPSARQVAAGAAGQELSEVAAANIQKNMDVPPTITIKPGQPFDVFLTSDVAFDGPYGH